VVDLQRRAATARGQALELSGKEFELLVHLMRNRGKALRKEDIFAAVWGSYNASDPSTLTVHIKRLRDKLERNPRDPRHIRTVWGVGYIFEA